MFPDSLQILFLTLSTQYVQALSGELLSVILFLTSHALKQCSCEQSGLYTLCYTFEICGKRIVNMVSKFRTVFWKKEFGTYEIGKTYQGTACFNPLCQRT